MAALIVPGKSRIARALRGGSSNPLEKPRGQVEINWSNPDTKGLLYLAIATPAGMYDLVTKRLAPITAGSANYVAGGWQNPGASYTRFDILQQNLDPDSDTDARGGLFVFDIVDWGVNWDVSLAFAVGDPPLELKTGGSEPDYTIRAVGGGGGISQNYTAAGNKLAIGSSVNDSSYSIDDSAVINDQHKITAWTAPSAAQWWNSGTARYLQLGDTAGAGGVTRAYIAALWSRPRAAEEVTRVTRNPNQLLRDANQSPILIGTAAAGVDYQETISSSVTSSASLVETYQAAGFSEVLASSVTSSANLVETYQAPSYSEVLASSVTSSATFAETYGAPAYSEVLASSVSSSANLVETYGAPNYSEVIASAVTSSASLVEAYEFGQNYQETITASVTSSATFAEAYQAPAYNETIAVSVTSSANLVETWEVAYTEVIASAVTSSATLAEIYESGLNFAETISASVTSSANLVETYGAPSYSEVLASAVTSSATFTEAFTTPQALPTIVELSAITLPGYSAKSLRID